MLDLLIGNRVGKVHYNEFGRGSGRGYVGNSKGDGFGGGFGFGQKGNGYYYGFGFGFGQKGNGSGRGDSDGYGTGGGLGGGYDNEPFTEAHLRLLEAVQPLAMHP